MSQLKRSSELLFRDFRCDRLTPLLADTKTKSIRSELINLVLDWHPAQTTELRTSGEWMISNEIQSQYQAYQRRITLWH